MDKKYGGMTVNERIYVSGRMKEFDKAVANKNVDKVIEILKEVELDHEELINPILASWGLGKDVH